MSTPQTLTNAKVRDTLTTEIIYILKSGGKVSLGNGIGSLEIIDKAARTGRNPATGEPVQIPAKKAIKFKMSSAMKAAINA